MTAASSLFLCSQFFSSSQRGTIMSASVLENRLRAKPEEFELRCNDSAKSNVWKHFSLVFEKLRTTSENISFVEVKYFCACNRCRRVYMYKAPDGSSFGTKNLLDHVKSCSGSKPASQLQILSNRTASLGQAGRNSDERVNLKQAYFTLCRKTSRF